MILNLSYKGLHTGYMRIAPRTTLLHRNMVEPDGSGVEFSIDNVHWFSYEEGLCMNGMAIRWDEVTHLIGVV